MSRPEPGRGWIYRREDFIAPRMRPVMERNADTLERSPPPLRAWGPRLLAFAIAALLLALMTFACSTH